MNNYTYNIQLQWKNTEVMNYYNRVRTLQTLKNNVLSNTLPQFKPQTN